MRSRGLVVVLALILATLATAGVFLYAQGVKHDAVTGGSQATVVVAKVDIPSNSDLNALIDQGQFVLTTVPKNDVVEGAVTEIAQLRNRRNSVPILANEQIPLARVQGGKVAGGVLGIPQGYQAVTISLDGPAAVGAALSTGDNVTVLATFESVKLTKVNKNLTAAVTPTGQTQTSPEFDATVTLVPKVQVLRVAVPTTQSSSGLGSSSQTSSSTPDRVSVTLALLPEDAQKFVFALEEGKVYLSLLPPGAQGVQLDPITVSGILFPPKANKGQ